MVNTADPLVTVVCLCYNHDRFVVEAVESIINQTYQNIEVIVVDDASTDNSAEIITELAGRYPHIQTILLKENTGNCAAFNRGFAQARGEFVIDLSADDVLMPQRVEKQVGQFKTLDRSYGVVFSDAEYIDEQGRTLWYHFERLFQKKLLRRVPQGDVFRDLVTTYFIASPTMMIRSSIMKELGGYDEQLTYEDFDFWIRSSKICKYGFLDERLTKIRKVAGSLSSGIYRKGDRHLMSTYRVCEKALALASDAGDVRAVAKRLKYELRQCTFSENRNEAEYFYRLLKKTGHVSIIDRALLVATRTGMSLEWVKRFAIRNYS